MENNVFKLNKCLWQDVTLEDIYNNIDDIDNIIIDGSFNLNNKIYECNNIDHPITYTCLIKSFLPSYISFEKNYYLAHKEKIDNLILYLCKNKKKKFGILSTELINGSVIEALSQNENMNEVLLGNNEDVFSLSSDVYKKFKSNKSIKSISTSAVDEELKDNFDSIIKYNSTRTLIGNLTSKDLQVEKIVIKDPINENELDNIKYISKDSKISIRYNDYNNILLLVNKLNYYNLNNQVIICLDNKDKPLFNEILFNNYDSFRNVTISFNSIIDEYDIKTYYDYEKYLTSLIEPAKDLSPFEKYLYAYNITKKYKKYKENDEDKNDARNLYKLLDNDYMVCVGFSKLLVDLLTKLGIESSEVSTTVETGFDSVDKDTFDIPDDVETKFDGHARVRVNLVDPKYNIDGIYVADVTWDNDLYNDSYSFCLMSATEYDNMYRKNYLSTGDELLFSASSLEDFYAKVNYSLNRSPKRYNEVERLNRVVGIIMDELNNIDSKVYTELYKIYGNRMKEIYYSAAKDSIDDKKEYIELFNSFIEYMGNYIVSKVNNPISGETLISGIRKLYNDFYGISEEEVENRLIETIEYNKLKYKAAFPNKKERLKDGTIVDYELIDNKFDIKPEKNF